jgi:hypothetical protein
MPATSLPAASRYQFPRARRPRQTVGGDLEPLNYLKNRLIRFPTLWAAAATHLLGTAQPRRF